MTRVTDISSMHPIGVPKNLIAGRLVVALSAPFSVACAYLLGRLILNLMHLNYAVELKGAAVISVIAGLLAVMPLIVLIGRGAIAIVHLTMIAMLIRMFLSLVGLAIACTGPWTMDKGVLVVATAGCYVALMIGESAATLWAAKH